MPDEEESEEDTEDTEDTNTSYVSVTNGTQTNINSNNHAMFEIAGTIFGTGKNVIYEGGQI